MSYDMWKLGTYAGYADAHGWFWTELVKESVQSIQPCAPSELGLTLYAAELPLSRCTSLLRRVNCVNPQFRQTSSFGNTNTLGVL